MILFQVLASDGHNFPLSCHLGATFFSSTCSGPGEVTGPEENTSKAIFKGLAWVLYTHHNCARLFTPEEWDLGQVTTKQWILLGLKSVWLLCEELV